MIPDDALDYEDARDELAYLEHLERQLLLTAARKELPEDSSVAEIVIRAALIRRRRRREKVPVRPEWIPGRKNPEWAAPVGRTLEEERRRQMQLLEEREREYQRSLETETDVELPDAGG